MKLTKINTNIQLIASKKKKKKKNNLKIATDCTGHCTCNNNLSYLLLDFKVLCCLGLVLLESIFIELESILLLESYFVSARYMLPYINTIYLNKNQDSCSERLSPSLSIIIHGCGGITLAWAHCSQL